MYDRQVSANSGGETNMENIQIKKIASSTDKVRILIWFIWKDSAFMGHKSEYQALACSA